MSSNGTVEERVQRGIAILDRNFPRWVEDIDLGRLNLRNCTACVLGQLYGNYIEGLLRLGLDAMTTAVDNGFDGAIAGSTALVGDAYRELTTEWKAQITARREAMEEASGDEGV